MVRLGIAIAVLFFGIGCAKGPIQNIDQKRHAVGFFKNFSKKNIGLSSLSADSKRLYWGSEHGHVIAVSAKTHKRIWTRRLKDPITTPISIQNQKVFVGTQKGTLYALDYDNGKTLWSKNYETSMRGPMVQFDKYLFFIGVDGKLLGVDMRDGAVVFEQSFFVNDSFTLQYQLHGERFQDQLILLLPSAEAIVLDQSLEIKWTLNLQPSVQTLFLSGFVGLDALGQGRFLVTPYQNTPFVLDAQTQETLPIEGISVMDQPEIADSHAYFIGQNKISKVDLETLQIIDTFDYQQSFPVGGSLLVQDVLLIATTNGSMDVYDLVNHEKKWTYITGAPLKGGLAYIEDQVFLLNQRGQLFAFKKPFKP